MIRTWQVKPMVHTMGLTLGLFVILLGGIEFFFRTNIVRQNLFIPTVSQQENRYFDLQVYLLENYIADQGTPDCFIVGSSMTQTGLLPSIIETQYYAQTHQPLHCFNFSIPGLGLDSAIYTAEWLLQTYSPKILILGTFISDYNTAPIKRALIDGDWLAYQNKRFNWQGWLLYNFRTYQYLTTIKGLNQQSINLVQSNSWSPDGSLTFYTAHLDLYKPITLPYPTSNFSIWRPSLDKLEHFLKKTTALGETQLILLEMPTHPLYMDTLPNPTADYQLFLDTLRSLANQFRVPFWNTNSLNLLPTESWMDNVHLRYSGMLIFSNWVGEQLGLLMQQPNVLTLYPEWILHPPAPTYHPTIEDYSTPQPTLPRNDNSLFSPSSLWEQQSWIEFNLEAYLTRAPIETLEWVNGIELLALLPYVQTHTDFSESEQSLLQAWSLDKDPKWLAEANIQWLLLDNHWLGWLSDAESQRINDPTQYQLITTWQHSGVNPSITLYLYKPCISSC